MTKKEQVKRILLMPINCSKAFSKIEIVDGEIWTPQLYYSVADADMSDLTIGFYEVLYADLIPNKKLLDGKDLINKEYAGDTMNSYNSLANIILENNERDDPRLVEQWRSILEHYHKQYHCLSNFWVIPMRFGRTGKKGNKYDSLEYFVDSVMNNYEFYSKKEDITYGKQIFKNYFNNGLKDDFCKVHYISYQRKEGDCLKIYKEKDKVGCIKLIEEAINKMQKRAEDISNDEDMCSKLFIYFEDQNLI